MKINTEWTVVGAGPAGIACVGKLIDFNVTPSEITWIDPAFRAGDFGTLWRNVNSNTPISSFIKFYEHLAALDYQHARSKFMIDQLSPEKNCPLMVAAQPLKWMTTTLSKQVKTINGKVKYISPVNQNDWKITLSQGQSFCSKKIILAIGSEARQLHFDHIQTPVIPLATALNPIELKQAISPTDRVVVFGGAQSAKSVLQNLFPIKTEKTILFYRSEESFSRHFSDVHFPPEIETLEMTSRNLLREIPCGTKIIYAIGFKRRHIPIMGLPNDYGYDKKTGEIAENIFGLGIAFPEILPFEMGRSEYPVSAIWPFMKRASKLMKQWL